MHLWLGPDNDLRFEPIKEIESLRGELLIDESNISISEADRRLKSVGGDMLEVSLELTGLDIQSATQRVDFAFRKSPTSGEGAMLSYVPSIGRVFIDRERSTKDSLLQNNTSQRSGILPDAGENLAVRLFIDHSMVEAYFNQRRNLTSRVFPVAKDATDLGLSALYGGRIRVHALKVWRMNPT